MSRAFASIVARFFLPKILPEASTQDTTLPVSALYRTSARAFAAHSGTGFPSRAENLIAHKSICLSPALNRSCKVPLGGYLGSMSQGDVESPITAASIISSSRGSLLGGLISAPAPAPPRLAVAARYCAVGSPKVLRRGASHQSI